MKKYIKPTSVTWWSVVALLMKAVATSVIEKRLDFEGLAEALALIGLRGAIN